MKEVKRTVSTGFWNDDKVLNDFSPEDKYFMLYLLTNPYTTQLGVYHIPLKKVALEIGYSLDAINVLLDRFENKYKIIRFNSQTSEVAIKNYLRYSIVKGGKPVTDCLEKDLKGIKDISLIAYVFKNINNNRVDINNTVLEFIDNHIDILDIYKENDIHNDNDNDNERIVDESLTNRKKSAKKPKTDIGEEVLNDYDFDEETKDVIRSWLKYKEEKRQGYKETGVKSFVKQVYNKCQQYGFSDVREVIERSMGSNYQGIVWNWLADQNNKKGENSSDRRMEEVSGVKQKFSEEDIEKFRRELGM